MKRGFTLLLITGLAVFCAFVVVRQAEVQEQPQSVRQLLFPGLKADLSTLVKIEIDTAGEKQLMERHDDVWTLPAKDHYPANQARIAQLLSNITNLTVIEQKTSDPARYADLSLGLPSKEPGSGHEIRLMTEKGVIVADLIVGRIATSMGRSGGGYYVRRADADESWLAEGTLDLPAAEVDWAERRVFDLTEPNAVKSTILKVGDKTIITVSRDKPDTEEFAMEPVPPGQPDQGMALRLATTAVSLDFEDVKANPAQHRDNDDDDAPVHTAIISGFDGVTYMLSTSPGAPEKDTWVTVAEAGPTPAIAVFNNAHRSWRYKIPAYRMDILRKDLAGFSIKPDPGSKPVESSK